MLSDELWRLATRQIDGALGRTVRINGQPFEIIGIAPARYRGSSAICAARGCGFRWSAEASLGSGSAPPATRCAIAAGFPLLDGSAPGSTAEQRVSRAGHDCVEAGRSVSSSAGDTPRRRFARAWAARDLRTAERPTMPFAASA